jgi:hypothetical protein
VASQTQHTEKADRNANFAVALDLSKQVNVEWAMTSLFYSSLHYVEAYCARVGFPDSVHNTHGKRDTLVGRDAVLRTIRNEYTDLKNFGLEARYECRAIPAKKVTDEAIPALNTIKSHIRQALAK